MTNRIFVLTIVSLLSLTSFAVDKNNFENPVLSGFHPDPSVCRVDDNYYMAVSSFEWYPGIPIYHSKDLVNWEQIGYALDRPSQLSLNDGLEASCGIVAPTLRYYEGLFYLTATCLSCGGNFYITAKDPAGPWSDPIWFDAPGIDPSLFWDDDGSCWYVGAANLTEKQAWEGQTGIFIQKLDLKTGKLIGEKTQLTFGYANNAAWCEGPRLYKINGRYLLITAEGGSGFNHAITVFDSRTINGKYAPSPINPVLTHRNLGLDYPITSVGHCDLVETQNGEWWALLVGVRPFDHKNILGRETFLIPLKFENGWPVFNPGIGKVQSEEHHPNLPWAPVTVPPAIENFDQDTLPSYFMFRRTPKQTFFKIEEGMLKMNLLPQSINQPTAPAFIGRRITDFQFTSLIRFDFEAMYENEEAGFAIVYSDRFHYRLVKTVLKGKPILNLIRTERGDDTIVDQIPIENGSLILGVKVNGINYQFVYGTSADHLTEIGNVQDATICSTSRAGGYTGPFVGMYASSNGKASMGIAWFDWFEYKTK